MATVHAKHGSSTARRDINCQHVHVAMEGKPVSNVSSEAAERGNVLHDVMEAIIFNDVCFDEATQDLTPDDVFAVELAVNATNTELNYYDVDEFVCEQFMGMPGRDDVGGTPDLIGVSSTRLTVVNIDYKFGRVPVDYWDQHLFGFMTWRHSPEYGEMTRFAEDFVAIIVQPAVSSRAVTKVFSAEDVDDFEKRYLKAIAKPSATGFVGDWCKYCPAARYCEAKRHQVAGFLDYDPKDQQDLAAAMTQISAIKDHITAIEAAVFSDLEAGRPVPGWKLVAKQARSFWIDPEQAQHFLRYSKKITKDMYITESLRSPSQVKTATRKLGVDLSPFISTASSGTTFAPESDKREAITPKGSVPAALDAIMQGKKSA